jgi:aspartyl-tRNA(Asn)/glutamyl-tRNA(Gln) amidotransferase subunit B
LKSQMDELPAERLRRYTSSFNITDHTAKILVNSKKISDFFEESLKYYPSPVEVSNWIVNEMLTKLNESEKSENNRISVDNLHNSQFYPKLIATMARLVEEKSVNRNKAREIFDICIRTGEDPLGIMKKIDIDKISDAAQIGDLIKKITKNQPHLVEQAKNNPNVYNYVLGLLMRETKGKADPQLSLRLIKETLSSNI